jgi:hypothetical protein
METLQCALAFPRRHEDIQVADHSFARGAPLCDREHRRALQENRKNTVIVECGHGFMQLTPQTFVSREIPPKNIAEICGYLFRELSFDCKKT